MPIPTGTTLAIPENREIPIPARMKMNPSNMTNSLA